MAKIALDIYKRNICGHCDALVQCAKSLPNNMEDIDSRWFVIQGNLILYFTAMGLGQGADAIPFLKRYLPEPREHDVRYEASNDVEDRVARFLAALDLVERREA